MDTYTSSITFKHVNTKLWTLRGNFSKEFVVGFLYGVLFGKIVTNAEYNYSFEFYAQRTSFTFHQLNYLILNQQDYFITSVPLYQIDRRETRKDAFDKYSIWLRFVNSETVNLTPSAWLVRFRTPAFLQGLLTSLAAFNIPYQDVILTAPIKDEVNYTINGVKLPDPDDYTDEMRREQQRIIEAAERAAALEEDREQLRALGFSVED
jgi:hypothetical protein